MIRAIAAIDDKQGIAAKGKTPWAIPADIHYFRDQTEGKTVVMGREMYTEFSDPLSGRSNVVVSHTLESVRPGFQLVHDIDTFLKQAVEDVWIIGGAGLYESVLGYCDELYLTHVQGDFDCDRFFPAYEGTFALKQESAWQNDGKYTYKFSLYGRST
jgi:dihydrofolate reductase